MTESRTSFLQVVSRDEWIVGRKELLAREVGTDLLARGLGCQRDGA